MIERTEQRIDSELDTGTGVDESVKGVHQHRVEQILDAGVLQVEFVQLSWLDGHWRCLTWMMTGSLATGSVWIRELC
jgi:hypothetical protein